MYYIIYNTTFLSSLTMLMNMSSNLQTQMQDYNLTWPTDFQFQNGRLYHFKKSVSENYPAHTYCHDRMAQLWDMSTWDNLQWIFEQAIPTLENNLNGNQKLDSLDLKLLYLLISKWIFDVWMLSI